MKYVSKVFVDVVYRRTAIMDRLFWLLINVERPSDPCRRLRNVCNASHKHYVLSDIIVKVIVVKCLSNAASTEFLSATFSELRFEKLSA